jgi:hypothetical protein
VKLLLRLAGAFLVALLLSFAVLEAVRDLTPVPEFARLALAAALGYGSGRWLRWLAARHEGRQWWHEWLEYRSALKKDETRRKAVRSRRP